MKNTIGFYSSGFWLRKEIGNIDLKDNAYQNEANLLIFLIDYVNEFKDSKLIILLIVFCPNSNFLIVPGSTRLKS